jgi:hypothetical protein
MALSSHFLSCDDSGHLHLDNHLLVFQVVDVKHDGKNVVKIMFDILKEARLLGKVRLPHHCAFKFQVLPCILSCFYFRSLASSPWTTQRIATL